MVPVISFRVSTTLLEDLTPLLEEWIRYQSKDHDLYSVEVCVASIPNTNSEGYFGLAFTTSEEIVASGEEEKHVPDWWVYAVSLPMYLNDHNGKFFHFDPERHSWVAEENIEFARSGNDSCYPYMPSILLRVEFREDGAHLFLNGVESDSVIPISQHPIRIGLWAEPSGGIIFVEIRKLKAGMLPK